MPAVRFPRLFVLTAALAAGALLPTAASATPASPDEVQTRIISGTLAADGSWPYQSAVMLSSRSDPRRAAFCGGTLIAPSWVLTAAHCVTFSGFPGAAGIGVAVGRNDLRTIADSDRIGVESVTVHPDYDASTRENDLALLLLKTPSSQTPATLITAAQAAAGVDGPTNTADIAGWGSVVPYLPGDPDPPAAFPYDLLEATSIPIISNTVCGSGPQYGGSFAPAVMLCAGVLGTVPAPGTDTCQGDSGGPLMAEVGSDRVLAGVTSFGAGCGTTAYGVYARVSSALGWISSTTSSFPLTVERSGSGSGQMSSSPAGISCGAACSASFADGTLVTLAAAPAAGSSFSGWSGAGCSGTGSCQVTMSQVRSVTASFTENPPEPTPPPTPPDNEFTLEASRVRATGSTVVISDRATVRTAGLLGAKAVARPRKGRSLRCSTSRSVPAAGSYALRCNLGTAGRRALRRSSLRVKLTTTFAPLSGLPRGTRTQEFVIARRREAPRSARRRAADPVGLLERLAGASEGAGENRADLGVPGQGGVVGSADPLGDVEAVGERP
jgi:secreted trypsin-like serine protease